MQIQSRIRKIDRQFIKDLSKIYQRPIEDLSKAYQWHISAAGAQAIVQIIA